jgi:response regulator NasT
VGEAANGQEALDRVAALHPDVVIMDIKMPVMDGLEATRRLMVTHPVPVIVLTAYNERTLVEQAADAGVLAYLMKPVREGDIKPAIEVARARFAELQWIGRATAAESAPSDAQSSRIAEATRILQTRHRLSEAEASARLRRLARNSRRSVAEIAEAILALEPPL